MFVDDIWKATERGNLEKVKEFIERNGIPDAEKEYESQSLLTVACKAGHSEVVRVLLENGDYLLGLYVPCAFAALNNGHIEVLRVLCEFGLEPDSYEYSKHGISLLETAVIIKQREAMLLFIEYGAEIQYSWWGPREHEFGYDTYDPEEISDDTTLEMAAFAGRPDLIEFFLELGAKVDEQNVESYLRLAREKEPLRLEFEEKQRQQKEVEKQQLFQRIEEGRWAIERALQAGIDANHTDENGNNMLFNLLQQKKSLDEEDLICLRRLAPLTDLSHANECGEHAWEIAESRGEIKATLYLMEQAGIPISSEKRARFERKLRVENIKKFLLIAALIIILSPLIVLALLLWGIVSLLLLLRNKISACFIRS